MQKLNDLQNKVKQKMTWSMEILPQNVTDIRFIPDFVQEVYITMIPGSGYSDCIMTAQKIQASGKQPIPHITARTFPGVEELRAFLSGLQAAGIERILLIGGSKNSSIRQTACTALNCQDFSRIRRTSCLPFRTSSSRY